MKLKVYEDKLKEKVIRLKLVENSILGDIRVIVVDEYGKEIGQLIDFTTDGRIERFHYVDKSWGFDLNKGGQIKVDDEGIKKKKEKEKFPPEFQES